MYQLSKEDTADGVGMSPYLEVLEEDGVARPVHLREEVLVQHFAHKFEQIDLALIVRLVLQQFVQRLLPFSVVHCLHKVP
jgi:hypothetical protein